MRKLSELFDFADRDQDGAINFEEYLINAFDYVEGDEMKETEKQEI